MKIPYRLKRKIKDWFNGFIQWIGSHVRSIIYCLIASGGIAFIVASFFAESDWKNVFSGIGTGAFSSLIVSLIINQATDRRIRQEKQDTKNFVFSKMVVYASDLYSHLIYNLNEFSLFSGKYDGQLYGLYDNFDKYNDFENVLKEIEYDTADEKLKGQLNKLFDFPKYKIMLLFSEIQYSTKRELYLQGIISQTEYNGLINNYSRDTYLKTVSSMIDMAGTCLNIAFENASADTVESGKIFSPQNWVKNKGCLKNIKDAVRTHLSTFKYSARLADSIIKTTDLSMDESKTSITVDDTEYGTEPATFNSWIYGIMKGGFGSPTVAELMQYAEQLNMVYQKITYEKNSSRYYSSKYNRKMVESNIRKAFCDKLNFNTTEELIPEEANLLNISNFTTEVYTDKPNDYYPAQSVVENIIKDDKGKLKLDPKMEDTIRFLEESGNAAMAATLRAQSTSHKNKDRSFHYLPYRTDSGFEQTFLKEVLSFDEIENLGLEVYYNGDRAMTEFKIKCYKKHGSKWSYVGMYTPDFLIIQRKDGKIHKVIVVETKGEIYAKDPTFNDKKAFMETEFSKQNNTAYGYERFDYLYLEDTLPEKVRLTLTRQKICEFFKEES